MSEVIIYTDGSSLSNPGKSGWAAVLKFNENYKEINQGYELSTNNRMEIMACIESLKLLKLPCKVKLHTDSKYVIDGITSWIHGWKQRGWVNSKRKPVENKDLWLILDEVASKHSIQWIHVKAHSGIELNERCDELAKEAANSSDLLIDENYK